MELALFFLHEEADGELLALVARLHATCTGRVRKVCRAVVLLEAVHGLLGRIRLII